MVENKHVLKMIALVMVAAVAVCFTAILFSNKLLQLGGGTGVRMEYESKLFDKKEVLGIDIRMDEDEWKKMLSNATAEEYYVCDVTIAGKTFRNVGIRPKGNSSLSSIAMNPDTDRFSMKLEFDHFVKGQSCFGLDKLILNNSYADSTNMKEALVYDMYAYLGTDASLYNYAKISVNGEYFGLYLALEGVEESFMLRCFGTQDGELYKPDGMDLGEFQMPDFENFDFSQFAPEGFDFSNFDWGNFGGFGQGAPGGFGGMPGQDGQGAPGGFGGMPGQDGQGAPGGFGGMPGQNDQGQTGGFGGW
ncbi:MAG: CotH kinase family protein, partial [Lachnospiraceae bacterium]|nr:CotH kinase family protein [Lachnospiraceae bacterium]